MPVTFSTGARSASQPSSAACTRVGLAGRGVGQRGARKKQRACNGEACGECR